MDGRTASRWGAALGLAGVALGAFGAHGLKGRVDADRLITFEIGVRYQMYHALALVLLARVPAGVDAARAAYAFLAGILVFSGSLYLLVFTGVTKWGAVTPFGGLAFLAGWAFLYRALGKDVTPVTD